MLGILTSTLLGMVAKIFTSDFIEFVFLKIGDILVKRTNSTIDDEFLAKIKEQLGAK